MGDTPLAEDPLAASLAASADGRAVRVMRRGLLALAVLGIAGTAFELATERHWRSWEQLIPWVALGLAIVALGLLRGRSRVTLRTARVLALVVGLTSIVGVVEHVVQNRSAGPLDATYGDRWATMSARSQWWAAFTKSVGPSPTLAPGILALVGACILLATVGHPRRRR